MIKCCPKCGVSKDSSEFHKHSRRKDGLAYWCKACAREWMKGYYDDPKHRKAYQACHVRYRDEALRAYSVGEPKCACCGETTYQFLSIDHIEGGGNEHRRAVGKLYLWLRRNNFPEGFQVLCYNCNFAKGHYGSCPHEESRNRF